MAYLHLYPTISKQILYLQSAGQGGISDDFPDPKVTYLKLRVHQVALLYFFAVATAQGAATCYHTTCLPGLSPDHLNTQDS